MGKTHNNQVNEYEVSLGIERLLIANHPQSWTPARIDIDVMPSGFYDLGAVVEDTPTFTYTRSFFELEAGLPKVTQYRATTGMEGTFALSLHSNSWSKLQVALGNESSISIDDDIIGITSISADGSAIYTSTSTISSVLAVGAGFALLTDAQGSEFVSGDFHLTALDVIKTSTFVASTFGNVIYVTSPILVSNPSSLTTGLTFRYTKQLYGTTVIKNYALLGVVDFIDGTQVVHYIPKASPNGDVLEEYRPETNSRIPLSFKAFGTRTIIGSCSQITVGERYEFPSISTC